jgi:hypothetical protein
MSVMFHITTRNQTITRRNLPEQHHFQASRENRQGLCVDVTDHSVGWRGVMNTSVVGRVPSRLLDRLGARLNSTPRISTLKLRSDCPIQVPGEVLLAHVDCHVRDEDLTSFVTVRKKTDYKK